MSLETSSRETDGIVILDLDGRLVVGEEVSKLREEISRLVQEGKNNIILNLKDVAYIDSTGLGSMVMGYTTAKKAGGKVKLLNLSRRNVELLVLTKLTTVFEVFDDEQSAINSFFPNRETRKFDILQFLQQQKKNDD